MVELVNTSIMKLYENMVDASEAALRIPYKQRMQKNAEKPCLQLLEISSFDNHHSYEIYGDISLYEYSNPFKVITIEKNASFVIVHTVWDRKQDENQLRNWLNSAGDNDTFPFEPTLVSHIFENESAIVRELVAQVRSIGLPLLPIETMGGTDGSDFELIIETYPIEIHLRWWEDLPRGWLPLIIALQRFMVAVNLREGLPSIRSSNTKYLGDVLELAHQQVDYVLHGMSMVGRKSAINEIPKEKLTIAGVCGHWSIKDIVAHLTQWVNRTIRWLEDGAKSIPLTIPEEGYGWDQFDAINEKYYLLDKDRPYEDIWAAFLKANADLEQCLWKELQITSEELLGKGRFTGIFRDSPLEAILANTVDHYQFHLAQIRAWLLTQG